MIVEYINTFTNLIQHKESESVEFKRAENNFDFDDLGKYFSALSNEANLRGHDFAWLIFGYDEKKHEIVGTSYKNGEGTLNNLKHKFSQHNPTVFDCKIYLFSHIYIHLYTRILAHRTFVNESLTILA